MSVLRKILFVLAALIIPIENVLRRYKRLLLTYNDFLEFSAIHIPFVARAAVRNKFLLGDRRLATCPSFGAENMVRLVSVISGETLRGATLVLKSAAIFVRCVSENVPLALSR